MNPDLAPITFVDRHTIVRLWLFLAIASFQSALLGLVVFVADSSNFTAPQYRVLTDICPITWWAWGLVGLGLVSAAALALQHALLSRLMLALNGAMALTLGTGFLAAAIIYAAGGWWGAITFTISGVLALLIASHPLAFRDRFRARRLP